MRVPIPVDDAAEAQAAHERLRLGLREGRRSFALRAIPLSSTEALSGWLEGRGTRFFRHSNTSPPRHLESEELKADDAPPNDDPGAYVFLQTSHTVIHLGAAKGEPLAPVHRVRVQFGLVPSVTHRGPVPIDLRFGIFGIFTSRWVPLVKRIVRMGTPETFDLRDAIAGQGFDAMPYALATLPSIPSWERDFAGAVEVSATCAVRIR